MMFQTIVPWAGIGSEVPDMTDEQADVAELLATMAKGLYMRQSLMRPCPMTDEYARELDDALIKPGDLVCVDSALKRRCRHFGRYIRSHSVLHLEDGVPEEDCARTRYHIICNIDGVEMAWENVSLIRVSIVP